MSTTKANKIDCGDCFYCIHYKECDYEKCGTCLMSKCQNPYCNTHQCRVNDLSCSCTTTRALELSKKYGSKDVFGNFQCQKCNFQWNSVDCKVRSGKLQPENCINRRCRSPVEPFKVRILYWSKGTKHNMEKCLICIEAGRKCGPGAYKPKKEYQVVKPKLEQPKPQTKPVKRTNEEDDVLFIQVVKYAKTDCLIL